MPKTSTLRRMSIAIAALALAWFALGNALNTMVAAAAGKHIDIVVCSGAGVKTISVPLSGDADNSASSNDDSTSSIKHCGNAPIYKLIALPGLPEHLQFQPPHTVVAWHWIAQPKTVPHRVQVNRPPPGRAPPAPLQA